MKQKIMPLVQARKNLGLTVAEAARQIGMNYGHYYDIEGRNIYPSRKNRERICGFYRSKGVFLLEEEVFPAKSKQTKAPRMVSLSDVDPEYLPRVEPEAEKYLEHIGLAETLDSALAGLNPTYSRLLKMLYGIGDEGHLARDKIASRLNVNPKRIPVMKNEALWELRRSITAERLKEFLPDGYLHQLIMEYLRSNTNQK